MTSTSFEIDSLWHRSRDRHGVLAGSPVTFFRVSEQGAAILDALENDTEMPAHHSSLTDRLASAGAIHPIPTRSANISDITVVIPAYVTSQQSLDHLGQLVHQLEGLEIVIVDDASPLAVAIEGTTTIRHKENVGPGPSRNTGLTHVTTAFVAFIDADTTVTTDDVIRLASVLEDRSVSLVAPRVRTLDDGTATGEYDSWYSPLDLGGRPAVIRPTSRVSYVPSAVIVVRVETLRALDAFDPDLRVGEDVDLVWRMIESGATCRYVPSVECSHNARPTILALLRQRYTYGTSAASLDKRHRLSASPLRANGIMLAMSLLVLSGFWLLGIVLALPLLAYFAVLLHRTGVPLHVRVRLTWMGFTSTTRLLASAITRAWWPIFLVASVVSYHATAMLVFSAMVPATVGVWRHKPRHPVSHFFLRIATDVAYGAGVWSGAWRCKSPRCLRPVISFRSSAGSPPTA